MDTASLDKGSASAKINELKAASSESNSSGSTTSSEDKKGEAINQPTESWTTGSENSTQKQKSYSTYLHVVSRRRKHITDDEAFWYFAMLAYSPISFFLAHRVICSVAAMAKRAGEDVNLSDLDKAEASKKIEDLKGQTGM